MNGYWMVAVVSLWILLGVVAVAQIGLLRRVAPLLTGSSSHPHHPDLPHGPDGLEIGGVPGEFRARTSDGTLAGRESLFGEPAVVVLTSVGCQPCDRLMAELRETAEPPLPVRLVLLVEGHVEPAGLPPYVTVLEQLEGSAAQAFRTTGTPYAFALDGTGAVRARGVPRGLADLARVAAAVKEVVHQPR